MTRTRQRSPGRLVSGLVVAATVAAVGITYILYPIGVRLAAWRQSRRHRKAGAHLGNGLLPAISVVVPAHNEAPFIQKKLHELLGDDYPADRMEVLVVDDGSTDGTATLARKAHESVKVLGIAHRGGKSAALNYGLQATRGEIVVFTDANASLLPGSLQAVARQFSDPQVAVVTGAKQPVGNGAHGGGESLYWRLEYGTKEAETAFGCAMGADGGIYAVRRRQFRPIPPGVYADDYWIPLDALQRGYHVAQAPGAKAVEAVGAAVEDDFERRTRIAAGIWAVSLSHLGLAAPRRGMVAVAFICHRLLRSIATPILLVLVLPATAAGRHRSRVLRWLWRVQLAGYGAALLGLVTNRRAFTIPSEFALLNAASLRGGARHLRNRQTALWAVTSRGPWHQAEGTPWQGADEAAA